MFTVNDPIAELYKNQYGVKINVIRNFPEAKSLEKIKQKMIWDCRKTKIAILQGGGINVDRGSEELLEAIALSNQLFLCIVGSGDVIEIKK